MRRLAPALALALALASPGGAALAQHAGHTMPAPAGENAASRGYREAMDRMMRDMPAPTGNADRDFLAGMIPHHQAAVDMARALLQHGRDPEVRRMAETIIRDQEREITEMRAMLARIPAR